MGLLDWPELEIRALTVLLKESGGAQQGSEILKVMKEIFFNHSHQANDPLSILNQNK